MLNPIGKVARSSRKGQRNFENCNLKTVSVDTVQQGGFYFSHIETSLEGCPTLEDYDLNPIDVENKRLTKKDHLAAKESLSFLAKKCGASVCANCVYADMETEVEVSSYRAERDSARLEEKLTHLALLQTQQQIAELEAQAGIIHPTTQLEIAERLTRQK